MKYYKNIFILYFRLKKYLKYNLLNKREYNNNTQSFNLNGCRV